MTKEKLDGTEDFTLDDDGHIVPRPPEQFQYGERKCKCSKCGCLRDVKSLKAVVRLVCADDWHERMNEDPNKTDSQEVRTGLHGMG